MKRMMRTVLLVVLWLSLSSVQAQIQGVSPPEVAAHAYMLVDVSAHQVLAEHLADEPVEPASLTKLMTAYVVFEALKSKKIDLKQVFGISVRAWKMPGSRMFIDPKMNIAVEDLLKGLIVQSGNDAAVALAEGVGGSVEHFVQMMNDQALRLGMTHTTYKNPEGLTATGHLTTARDLSILAQRLMQDFPEYIGFYAIKHYRYAGTPVANDGNRNLLLFRDPTVDGLKTGHTDAAGYCMIATAKRDVPGFSGRRLLSIVLGAVSENSRAAESQKILNWGYTAFEPVKLYEAGQPVMNLRLWKGRESELPVGKTTPIVVAVPEGQSKQLSSKVEFKDPLVAPVGQGTRVAHLKLFLAGVLLGDIELESLKSVEEASIFGRAWDALRLWIK